MKSGNTIKAFFSKKENILLILFCVSLLPFFYTWFHSIPSPDDFSMADINPERSLFSESVRLAVEYWYGWVGMWFASFYETFFNPLNLFGDFQGYYGMEMIIIFLFFIVSIYVLIRTLVYHALGTKDCSLMTTLFVLCAFTLINIDIYFEIFAWFVGSHYVLCASLSFLFISWLIMHVKYKYGWLSALFMSLLGIITCSNYMVAVPVGVIYLFILWEYSHEDAGQNLIRRYILNRNSVPLYFCIVGGVLAVFAPGNFLRNSEMSVSLFSNLKTALQNTLIAYEGFSSQLIYNPLLFFCFAATVIIACLAASKFSIAFRRCFLYMDIVLLLVPPITLFPVALGYESHEFPNRIQFVFNTYAIAIALFGAFQLGLLLHKKFKPDKKFFYPVYIMMIIGIYVSMFNQSYMSDFPVVRMVRDRIITRDFSRGWYDILNEIKFSEDDDIVIYASDDLLYIDPDPLIKSPGIYDDPNNGANMLVAKYYGKNSVRVLSREQAPE